MLTCAATDCSHLQQDQARGDGRLRKLQQNHWQVRRRTASTAKRGDGRLRKVTPDKHGDGLTVSGDGLTAKRRRQQAKRHTATDCRCARTEQSACGVRRCGQAGKQDSEGELGASAKRSDGLDQARTTSRTTTDWSATGEELRQRLRGSRRFYNIYSPLPQHTYLVCMCSVLDVYFVYAHCVYYVLEVCLETIIVCLLVCLCVKCGCCVLVC